MAVRPVWPWSMMGSKGMPSACETDVMGAVSMLALLKAGGVPPIYQDRDNNYATVPDKCVNVHCCTTRCLPLQRSRS